jgi:hypothetical protein
MVRAPNAPCKGGTARAASNDGVQPYGKGFPVVRGLTDSLV